MRGLVISLLLTLVCAAVPISLSAAAEPNVPSAPSDSGGGGGGTPGPVSYQPAEAEYIVELRCHYRGEAVLETEINLIDGFTAVIANSRYQRADRMTYSSVVLLRPADGTQLREDARVAPEALACAQHFSFAELDFLVYCPGADTFEVLVSRVALELNLREAGGAAGQPTRDVTKGPPKYLGRLSVALHTPDAGWFVPPPVFEVPPPAESFPQ